MIIAGHTALGVSLQQHGVLAVPKVVVPCSGWAKRCLLGIVIGEGRWRIERSVHIDPLLERVKVVLETHCVCLLIQILALLLLVVSSPVDCQTGRGLHTHG